MSRVTLTTIGSRYGSIDALNANFDAIEAAFDNVLFLDGTIPNNMDATLDMNSNRIINLPAPTGSSDAVTKAYVDTATGLLNGYVTEIALVANNITDVVTVADNVSTIIAVADDINDVAAHVTEILTVADNIGSVELVGLDLNGAFEQGVVYDFGSITEDPLGGSPTATSSIVIVANNITDVSAVATINTAVSAVATIASDVTTVANNIVDVQNAEENANAAISAKNDAVSAKNDAVTAQIAAEAARDSALGAYDSFDDRYLGAKASDPSVDNDGNALLAGALYFNTTVPEMRLYTGSAWVAAYVSGGSYLLTANNLSDLANTATARTNLGLGTAATTASTDYATAAQGALADTAFQSASAGDLATLNMVGTAYITNNAVTVDKLAATLDYGSIV